MSPLDDPTDHDAVDDEGPLRKERIDIQRKVSLKFKEFRGFITEFSENISTGGMFIRTTRPQPPGSIFDFEFTLGEDYTLIHGLGEVVWVREGDEGFDRPSGMGVRFLSLDPESRRLIDEIVARRLENLGRSQDGSIGGWGMGEAEADASLPSASTPPVAPPAAGAAWADEGEGISWETGPVGRDDVRRSTPAEEVGEPEAPGEPEEPERTAPESGHGEALSDLSDLVGVDRRETPSSASEKPPPYISGSLSPYARSYRSYQLGQAQSAAHSSRLSGLLSSRPLTIVLALVVAAVLVFAGFFLLAPEKTMNLLIGSPGRSAREAHRAKIQVPAQGVPAAGAEAPAAGAEAPAAGAEAPAAGGETLAAGGETPAAGAEAPAAGAETPAAGAETPANGSETPTAGPGSREAREANADRSAEPSGETASGALTVGPTASGASASDGPRSAGGSAAGTRGAKTATATAMAPTEPLPAEPDDQPFTRILNITWQKQGDQLLVTIFLDGEVREWDYTLVRINAPPPRELVRLRGAKEPFPRTTIPVDSDLVERVRTGFHPRDGEDEIHVVLDLSSPDVVLQRSEAVGDEIRLYLGLSEESTADDEPPS